MGYKRSKCIIWVVFYILLFQSVHAMDSYNPHSLDDFVHDYAYKAIPKPKTGTIYNISLPSNFSGIDVSIVQLRSGSLRTRGVNFSFFQIPPKIVPSPFVMRLVIVSQNLGNWSNYYYNVPNFTLVTPVFGFMTYNAWNSSTRDNALLGLSINGGPISVHFPKILARKSKNATLKCVSFGTNGTMELSNVSMGNVCVVRGQGHFGIVVSSKKKERFWKWWVMFVVGLVGLVLGFLGGLVIYKVVRVKKIEGMERQSEKSEALEIKWIGMTRMPSASGIRTQPELENDYVP